jgi:inorganic pyrophosphatase/exopolyphosphatase
MNAQQILEIRINIFSINNYSDWQQQQDISAAKQQQQQQQEEEETTVAILTVTSNINNKNQVNCKYFSWQILSLSWIYY